MVFDMYHTRSRTRAHARTHLGLSLYTCKLNTTFAYDIHGYIPCDAIICCHIWFTVPFIAYPLHLCMHPHFDDYHCCRNPCTHTLIIHAHQHYNAMNMCVRRCTYLWAPKRIGKPERITNIDTRRIAVHLQCCHVRDVWVCNTMSRRCGASYVVHSNRLYKCSCAHPHHCQGICSVGGI